MARGVHSYRAYIVAELKMKQIWRGSFEAEGHITRQISAYIHKREVYIVLTLALIFIIMVAGRYVACTKVDILQANQQLFSLVCWVRHAAENLMAMDENYGFESASTYICYFPLSLTFVFSP